jgi:hypothetical protein
MDCLMIGGWIVFHVVAVLLVGRLFFVGFE